MPALLSDLLPNVKSISDLRCVLETIQQHTRVESDVQSNSTAFVASCGLALVALDVKWWAWLSVAAIAGVGAVMWKQWFGPKPPPPPPPVPKPQIIPYSPVFSEVLDELLGRNSEPLPLLETRTTAATVGLLMFDRRRSYHSASLFLMQQAQ